jgi:glycosyltransferase involved in cell wall biosynthesis
LGKAFDFVIAIEFIVGSLEVGGAERHLSQVLPVLRSAGFLIKVHVLSNKAPLKPLFDKAGIPVYLGLNLDWMPSIIRRPIRLMVSLAKLMISFLKNRKAIRHVFLPEAYLLTALAARLTFFSGSLVMSRRSLNDYQQRRTILGKLERLMHRFTTIALGNSKAVVHQLYDEGFEPGKVGLIYNGIDLWPFQNLPPKQELREDLGFDQDALIFIIVANLIPYKGHLDLLNALAAIHAQLRKSWKLLCVGRDGGILSQLKSQARTLGIEEHVEFLGGRSDTPKLLAAADIGILCSHEEGFSNAILEGMAAGLPMVVTNVGGNAEAVEDMCTGLVVLPKNPESLADGLLSMALAPALRTRFGNAGKERVHQHFTVTQCAKKYAEFYISLADAQAE